MGLSTSVCTCLTRSRLLYSRLAPDPLIPRSLLLAHLACHSPPPLRAQLLDALDRGEQDLEPHVDEVDVVESAPLPASSYILRCMSTRFTSSRLNAKGCR